MTSKCIRTKTKTALFFSQVKKVKYYPEDSSEDMIVSEQEPEPGKILEPGDQFELLIGRKLLKLGFERIDLESTDLKKEDVENKKETTNYSGTAFIKHPLGKKNHPDYLIFEGGKVFYVECKSARCYNPKWGSAFPRGNDIWVFCCGKKGETGFLANESTFCLGKDYVPFEEYLDGVQKERKAEDRELNDLVKETTGFVDLDKRFLKFNDRSKKHISLLFHPDRAIREDRVMALTNGSKSDII